MIDDLEIPQAKHHRKFPKMGGTPKSSIMLIGFSTKSSINHPLFWWVFPWKPTIFWRSPCRPLASGDPGSRAVLPVPRDAIPFLRGGDLKRCVMSFLGGTYGKMWGKHGEMWGNLGNYGKILGTYWRNMRTLWEQYGKHMGVYSWNQLLDFENCPASHVF